MAGKLESLDIDDTLKHRRHRHWFDRLMMLSDGVFAIAITLLAAEFSMPRAWDGGWSGLWAGLAPQLDTYSMGFLVISIYWLAHRRFMAMILTVDAPVTVFNLMALGLIALVPAATRLINDHPSLPAARLVYAALVVAIGAALALMWAYAALIARRVSNEVSWPVRWFLLALIVFTPPFFLLLTMAIPSPAHGVIPLTLAGLFLLGWPMRLWVVRRLGGKSYVS